MNPPVPIPTTRPRTRALIALILLVPAPTVGVVAGIAWKDEPWGTAVWALSKVWLLGLPLIWHLAVDRGRWSWSPARRGGFVISGLIGLAMGGCVLGGYFVLGPTWIDPDTVSKTLAPLGLTQPEIYIGGALYWILVNSVLEEMVYRWFIFSKCLALMPSAWAVAASALIFVIHHAVALSTYFDPPAAILCCVGIFIGGATWSWLYQRYESIWVPYLCHALVDVAVFTAGWLILFG